MCPDITQKEELEDYQKNDTEEVLRVIRRYFEKPDTITVLDVGCSAAVVKHLAHHVKRIVGINIYEGALSADACPKNVELLLMDARQMAFPDEAFDFVYSANLCEHIADLSKSLDEALRVLKPGGYAYARWEPLWSGPRGHHIHEDMVQRWEDCCVVRPKVVYKNDGTIIDDWSHLLLSKNEMFESLAPRFGSEELTKYIVDYIYDSGDLNRLFLDDVKKIFAEKNANIVFWGAKIADIKAETLHALKKKYGDKDFASVSSEVLFCRG